MTVNLKPGMTAIRYDGERVGPAFCPGGTSQPIFQFESGGHGYWADGKEALSGNPQVRLIAAGYPWATLGAQGGDTVRRVWNGWVPIIDDMVMTADEVVLPHRDSLYVIEARAAKPADRPRAAHKLDLCDGDVVELVKWQGVPPDVPCIGAVFTFHSGKLTSDDCPVAHHVPSPNPKGHRPLFTVVSRANAKLQKQINVGTGHLHLESLLAGQEPQPRSTTNFEIPVRTAREFFQDQSKQSPRNEFGVRHVGAGGSGGVFPKAKPDEVIVRFGVEGAPNWWAFNMEGCTHEYTITFPHGGDVGTVTRERL